MARLETSPEHAARTAQAARGGDVLVVIPTLNEEAHVEACLGSLMTGDPRLAEARFVVADGGSSDATREIVEAMRARLPNLVLLDNPKRLQSAAVNAAAQAFGDDTVRWLVRCDAHSVYPPGYVMQVADALVRTGAQSVVTPMDAAGTSCFQKANAWIVDTPLGSGGSAHRGGRKSGYVDHGHHAGFDLETFLALGGYDEAFSHNEDGEYDRRLVLSGGRIWLDAGIRLTYKPRATVCALARQYWNYGRGRARNLMKHSTPPKPRQMIPVANFLGLLAAFAGAPILPWLLAFPAFYLTVLAAASLGVALWRRSACGLFAGLASGVMHNAWAAGFLRHAILR